MSRRALEAAIRRNHGDEDAWTIYADLLMAAGDVRGELIGLEQLADRSKDIEDARRWREQARGLFARHRMNLLGPLTGAKVDLEWIRGFVIEAIIHDRYTWITQQLLGRDIGVLLFWLTYRGLDNCEAIADVIAGSWVETVELRSSRAPVNLSPLARITGLRELILQSIPATHLNALAQLEQLERLLLRNTDVSFYGVAEGFPALRHLESSLFRHGRVRHLDGLANLGKLEVLLLPHEPVVNIDVLAELCELRELDLSGAPLEDIGALLGLPKLERVNLSGCQRVPPEQIEALRERGVKVNSAR
jgi:uncharacterized protein (TIGR02996 family)